MRIVHAKPPMFEEILAAFPMASRPGIFFTWGDAIYNLHGEQPCPEIRAHEGVHYSRQGNDTPAIEAWWRRYLIDPEFRIAEEVPAYRAQARAFKANHPDRNAYFRYAHALAGNLSGGLYGAGLITASKARALILT